MLFGVVLGVHSGTYQKWLHFPKTPWYGRLRFDSRVIFFEGMWYAENEGHTDIVELLRKHGAKE